MRVFDAHDQAVEVCVKVIEEGYAATRIVDDGTSKVVNTGNIIAAQFNHPMTRYGEMEQHTHVIITVVLV